MFYEDRSREYSRTPCGIREYSLLSVADVSDPASVLHLKHRIGLLCHSGIVGDDDNRTAVIVSKTFQNLHDVFRVG